MKRAPFTILLLAALVGSAWIFFGPDPAPRALAPPLSDAGAPPAWTPQELPHQMADPWHRAEGWQP